MENAFITMYCYHNFIIHMGVASQLKNNTVCNSPCILSCIVEFMHKLSVCVWVYQSNTSFSTCIKYNIILAGIVPTTIRIRCTGETISFVHECNLASFCCVGVDTCINYCRLLTSELLFLTLL